MPASIGSLSELSILYELHDSCSPSYLSLWNILQTGWLTCVIVTCQDPGWLQLHRKHSTRTRQPKTTHVPVSTASLYIHPFYFSFLALDIQKIINWFCHAFALERWTQTSLRAKFRLHSVYSRTSTGSIWLITSSLDQYRSQRQPRQDLTYLPTHSTCKWCQSYFLHL